jgi:iron uptake system component EfeO
MRCAIPFLLLAVGGLSACSGDGDATPEERALLDVKAYVAGELGALHQAALDLQAAAPEPDTDGWNATDDAAAVTSMREAWKRARLTYERVEGAIAVLFPHLDASTDERYDGFIAEADDDDLFDGTGVTGVHGIERILWADVHPPHVVTFETALPGYVEARFPATEAEATAFRDALLGRLVDDTRTMRDDFGPLALDPAAAFRGVIGSMEEQLEKVTLAATGEDESRYAQHTLGDMRANLEGGRAIYGAFREWVRGEGGAELDARIVAGFDGIAAQYAMHPEDGIPEVPDGWNPDAPSAEHLATPYGELWQLLTEESDPDVDGSLVAEMNAAAETIGIPQLP